MDSVDRTWTKKARWRYNINKYTKIIAEQPQSYFQPGSADICIALVGVAEEIRLLRELIERSIFSVEITNPGDLSIGWRDRSEQPPAGG